MKIAATTLFTLLALLVPAAGASAVRVPPGNSAATQYSETVPGAGGEEGGREANAGKSSGGQEGGGAKSSVPAVATAELEALGPEGEAALKLANSARPPRHPAKAKGGNAHSKSHGGGEGGAGATGPGSSGTPGGGSTSTGVETGGSSSGVGEVLGGAVGTSGGGLGFLQPIILATVILGACAYLVDRRRRARVLPGDPPRL